MPQSSIDSIVAENLREILSKKGRSAYSVATATGHAPNWLYRVLNQKAGILVPTLRELAEELGVSVGELVDPPNDPMAADRNDDRTASVDEFAYPVQEEHSYSNPHAIAQVRAGYNIDEANDQDGKWNVPIREVRPAAGSGAEVFGEEVVGYVPFRRNWLVQHDIDPAQADVVQVSGDSMEPTLPDGCSILVDRKRRELQPKRVYVLRNEDGLVVKRVDRNREGWWVLSDNPSWLPLVLTEGTDIIGEVRWCGSTF